MSDLDGDRRMGKAWRNAVIAFVAVGLLALGTQGVLSAMDSGALSDNTEDALETCGQGGVESVSEDGFACEE